MSENAPKGYKGLGMEGPIASWYAKNTQKNMEDFIKDAERVVTFVPKEAAILEVAPGPGYLSIELAKLGNYKITGLDISKKFVEIAQDQAKKAGVEIDFRHGNASQMPFDDNMFDLIVCRAAFKNFSQPIIALNEIYRVLKDGGKAIIFDLRGNVSNKEITKYVDEELNVSRINSFLTKWIFKTLLIKRAYTKDEFSEMVSKSKFKACHIQESTISFEIELTK